MMLKNQSHPTRLSVVIPAYNEESTLARVVQNVIEVVPHLHEIIIVDDGSTDRTGVVAGELDEHYTQDPSPTSDI